MNPWKTNLSKAEEERLTLLIEECSEVIKEASKVKRFGYFSTYGGSHPPNIVALQTELGDVLGIIKLMETGGDIAMVSVEKARDEKLVKMRPYVQYQADMFELIDEEKAFEV